MKKLLLFILPVFIIFTIAFLWFAPAKSFADVNPQGSCTVDPNCTITNNCNSGMTATKLPDQNGKCFSQGQCICTCPSFLPGVQGVSTGLGCIPYQPQELVSWVLWFLARVITGISLLLLLYGGIRYVLASGNPEGVEEAKSVITAGVTGLLLTIFSVLILRVIGIDVLGLPGFSWTGGGLVTP